MSNTVTPARMELLNELQIQAYKLRKQGMKYKEIGERIGLSAQRAGQIYRSAEYALNREPDWRDGLSVRAANCLNNVDIHSREAAMEAYQSGKLTPGNRGPRNYGWTCHKEVAKWLGLPEPQKPAPQTPSKTPLVSLLACIEYHERMAKLHESMWISKGNSRYRAAEKHRLQMLTHKEWIDQIRRLVG